MNNDLMKILTNTIIDFTSKFKLEEENLHQQKKSSKEKNNKFYEDDFKGDKRKNRIFTQSQKEQCWKNVRFHILNNKKKAYKVKGRDPERWRYDASGNIVMKHLKGCHGPLCHEYDHIIPYSKGGETTIRNCQILQTYANKIKGNKIISDPKDVRNISIKTNYTDYEMDFLEQSIYGNVKRL